MVLERRRSAWELRRYEGAHFGWLLTDVDAPTPLLPNKWSSNEVYLLFFLLSLGWKDDSLLAMPNSGRTIVKDGEGGENVKCSSSVFLSTTSIIVGDADEIITAYPYLKKNKIKSQHRMRCQKRKRSRSCTDYTSDSRLCLFLSCPLPFPLFSLARLAGTARFSRTYYCI